MTGLVAFLVAMGLFVATDLVVTRWRRIARSQERRERPGSDARVPSGDATAVPGRTSR